MPAFAYTAMDKSGSRTRGVCESADIQAAVASLRSSQMYVLEIRPTGESRVEDKHKSDRLEKNIQDYIGLPVTTRDRIQFLRQICLMLRSGLPLLQALEVFSSQSSKTMLARAIRRVATRIQNGESFSASLGHERGLFPSLSLKMIATGETIGELDIILDRMANHMERQADLRNSLLTSMAYPCLLLVVTIGVVVFLVTKIIPQFVHLLQGRNLTIPETTQRLIDITNFLNAHGLQIVIGSFAFIFTILALTLVKKIKFWIDRILLLVPVIGGILTLAFLAHFGRTLAILLKSGVPLLDSMRILGGGVGNAAFARHIERAGEEVLSGRSLSQALRASIVPSLLPELVSVGEISGTLDNVLDDVALFYEKKLEGRIKWMSGLFEPLLILVVGGMVGYVYIAFFSVLYQVSAG